MNPRNGVGVKNCNGVIVNLPNELDFERNVSQETSMDAVLVKNACKTFEVGQPVLNQLNITVQPGTIYGLLGPSGCGKTTILSCIVGLRKLDSGEIKVFGNLPGSKESGIPGRTIGYMPQDIALYEIFSIEEMLQYFGRIYGMTQSEIKGRIEFLVDFLKLPDCSSRIECLSGGEKRRTSLAVAMIHEPELLLLDEPTVGVDPLLRESIWKHLCEVVNKRQTTIIITTHYIEEAKQFNTVGLMRNGRLLVESSPLQLLKDHGTEILEDIVLTLCKKDNQANVNCQIGNESSEPAKKFDLQKSSEEDNAGGKVFGLSYTSKREHFMQEFDPKSAISNANVANKSCPKKLKQAILSHADKIQSLIIRNFLTLFRTPLYFLVIVFIPLVQVTLGNFIVGRLPINTAIGVVNNDVYSTDMLQFCQQSPKGCLADNLSCNFLNQFPPDEIKWISYSSEEEALKNVQNGNTWGFITIPQNYTQHLRERSLFKNFVDNETLDGTTIKTRLDLSFSLKSDFLISRIFARFQEFVRKIVSDCGGDPRSVDIPLIYNAIYGSTSTGYLEYLQPAQLILTIFLLPMASSVVHLRDQKAGTLDRSVVAGVQDFHHLVAFMVSEGSLICIQLCICLSVLVFGFNFEIAGSACLFVVILLLQGLTGMSIGFLIGSFCTYELELMLSIIAMYISVMVASGATWPIEGLGKLGRIICYSLPTTLPIEASRSIISRGWGLAHPSIWTAIGIMVCWIIGSCFLSGSVRRMRK